jgi:Tfp pilus assembly protein PilF
MEVRSNNSRAAFLALILALATLILFGPVIYCDFVNFDDPDYVLGNPIVQRGLTVEGASWALRTGHAFNWHPMTWISHMADCQLYGIKPGGPHLTNLLFHIGNTVLLFLLLKRMTGALWRSALVAALFALHPLRLESVAWVCERKDVLSGFFWMLTLWAYARYAGGKTPNSKTQNPKSTAGTSRNTQHETRYYFLSLFFFALGLMSKPMLVTLPFVLLLLDVWPLGRMSREASVERRGPKKSARSLAGSRLSTFDSRLIFEKIPFFALAALSSLVTFLVQRNQGAVEHLDVLGFAPRLANALISYVRYSAKLFWPVDLSVYYPYPDNWPVWQVTVAGLLLLLVSIAVIGQWRRRPYLAVGWFWFVGTLVPVIGLVQVGTQSMADRYTYLPMIGLLLTVVWGVAELAEKNLPSPKVFLGLAAAAAVAGIMVMTAAQLPAWRNSQTLFEHALNADSNNVVAHVMLGNTFEEKGQFDQAALHYKEAARIKPYFAEVHYNLGNLLAHQRKFDEAVAEFEQALQLRPDAADTLYNVSMVFIMQGKREQAIASLTRFLQVRPDEPNGLHELTTALGLQGKFAEAFDCISRGVNSNPENAILRNDFGHVLFAQNKWEEATAQYATAARLDPSYPEAQYYWGRTVARQGKAEEAKVHLREALRIKPDYGQAQQLLEQLTAGGGK